MTERYRRLVQAAAWTAMVVATVLLGIKLVAWWYTSSMSLLASVVDSTLDILASLTNLIVIRFALQPADEEHKFGHGKAESLAALAQSTFIVGSACFLILQGIERLFRPSELSEPGFGIYVSIAAIALTGGLVMFQKWVVRKTGSQAIAADSLHYQSDLLMNVAIIVALALSAYGFIYADAGFAILVGIFILFSAYKMARDAVQSLLDHQLPPEEEEKILTLASGVAGVHGVHDLRTRQAGVTRFIQLHLELDDELPLKDAHLIADEVEDRLEVVFPGADILIHQDPVSVVRNSRREQAQL
ncbi:CDF family cation-efflux transporter FieF [Parasalinivibrio latis]|uniref:CDF family cation-efflux transporter FieF n=1 Tax=Parasalinivibrio latis TaxID=2952610 RepID=UPI0030E30C25